MLTLQAVIASTLKSGYRREAGWKTDFQCVGPPRGLGKGAWSMMARLAAYRTPQRLSILSINVLSNIPSPPLSIPSMGFVAVENAQHAALLRSFADPCENWG